MYAIYDYNLRFVILNEVAMSVTKVSKHNYLKQENSKL